MQTPNEKTPVYKCLDLAAYSARMMSKFKDSPVLLQLSAKMQAAGDTLAQSQQVYEDAVRAILPARVDVKYENYTSDLRIRRTQKLIELADGKDAGPIGVVVFPGGSSSIIRLIGDSQVQAMKDLEGRLGAAKSLWPDAESEQAETKEYRERYAKALKSRAEKGQNARNLRAERDAEKGRFLKTYVGIAHQVEAEFPRDRVMQDLFFDEVRGRSTEEQASGDEEVPEGDEGGVAPAGGGSPPS